MNNPLGLSKTKFIEILRDVKVLYEDNVEEVIRENLVDVLKELLQGAMKAKVAGYLKARWYQHKKGNVNICV